MNKRRRFLIGAAGGMSALYAVESFALNDPSPQRKSAAPPWTLEGVAMENCSCRYFCVCNIGAVELADGWHAGTCVYDIRQGASAGVDLSGMTVVTTYVMPGGFADGHGTGRTYIGDTASPDQHKELEAIFNGERGGVFASFRATSAKQLPTNTVRISLSGAAVPRVKVADLGEITLRRLKTRSGKQTTLHNAVYLEAFGIEYEELCDATGSYCADPAMRPWRSGGAGGIAAFKVSSD